MPNPTLREIVETFTEEELALTVPIEFQDVSLEDYPYVNEYNRLLASAQVNLDTDEGYNAFQSAYEYRLANKDRIDKYIIDAKKLNILMTLVINAYMFSKGEKSAINTSYDNKNSGASSTNVQDVIDELQDVIDECFQSVSNGKALVASAITDKRVATDATATFTEMAANIAQIVLGSGNATPDKVLKGYTFTNDDGVEYTGTYDFANETEATATAAMITKGYTAWVNGKLITGTRALPVTSLTGSKTWKTIAWGAVVDFTINFSTAFDSVPAVTITGSGAEKGFDQLKVLTVTRSYFTGRFEPGGTPGEEYDDITINWTAATS